MTDLGLTVVLGRRRLGNGRSSESKRACSFCRVVTDEEEFKNKKITFFLFFRSACTTFNCRFR